MEFIYNDGGRSNYFKGTAGDCFTRAVCNATGMDYKEVYDLVNEYGKKERIGKRKHSVSKARDGVYSTTARKIMADLGWLWKPTMQIGSGCTTHLSADELPSGTIICLVSRHYTCVKDGVVYDTYDCTRDENRCVYGYWYKPADRPKTELEQFLIDLSKEKQFLDGRRKWNSPINFGIMDGVIVCEHLSIRLNYKKADLYTYMERIADYVQNELRVGTLFYIE